MPATHAAHSAKTTKKSSTKAKDAIDLLKADHREVEKLAKEFEAAKSSSRKAAIVRKICDALTVHATIEEEVFYPAAREALKRAGEDMLDEAEVEHASIKDLVAQLESAKPEDDLYDAKVKVLTEYVNHHVEEEEGEMFPKVRKTKLDLDSLGEELAARKSELTADGRADGNGNGR